MQTLKALCKAASLLVYALWILFVALTKYQKVDAAEKGRMAIYYNRRILKLAGLNLKTDGNVPKSVAECGLTATSPGMVLVSNHISFLDIFCLDGTTGCRFVAKSEIANWPIFGGIARAIGTLFINRASHRAILQINEDIKNSLERKEVVGLFAEGTTTFGNSLLPIKSNFFGPAVELGATIQPAVLVYRSNGVPTEQVAFSGEITLMKCLWNVVNTPNAEATLHFLEPIDPTGMNRHQVGQLCEQRMREFVKSVWKDKYIESDPRVSEYLEKVTHGKK